MGSHRRPAPSGLDRGARSATLCVLSAAAATLGVIPAGAEPTTPQEDARAEVDRLYAEAEWATKAHNKADERADTLRKKVTNAQDRIARQQDRINTMRNALGSLAGAEYRSGGLDPTLALMFSDDPDDYLDKAAVLDRISARQAGALRGAMRDLSQEREEATRDLAELEQSRAAVARHKHTVEGKFAKARQLLSALPDDERAAYDRASRSGRVPDLGGTVPPSARAAAAVAAARSAVGRPYVWGANGPTSFDCSGLVQWSYAQAGVGLPRTSQAQVYAGRQVPLSQAQPGDLVTYRSDASHIGMYMGNGQVIHAPYPGAPVRYDPVGMMPILSVTRP
ncbi:C40 family peptidase [Streptomyces pseudoechinosporeus]